MKNQDNTKAGKKPEKKEVISRREALRKLGYAAFASSTMLFLLNNPTKVHASSPGDPGDDWDWGDKNDGWDDDWD